MTTHHRLLQKDVRTGHRKTRKTCAETMRNYSFGRKDRTIWFGDIKNQRSTSCSTFKSKCAHTLIQDLYIEGKYR